MIAFYSTVLSCTVEKRQPAIGLVHLRAGNALIDLLEDRARSGDDDSITADDGQRRKLDHFCLRVASFDFDEIHAHLAKYGVDVAPPALRYGAEGLGLSVYFQDPEGNTIELKGPPNLSQTA